jgi:hypothetical protein
VAFSFFLAILFGSAFRGHSGCAYGQLTPNSPEVKDAVAKAVQWLKANGKNGGRGHRSFAAATLMRANVPPEDPFVQGELKRIVERCAVDYAKEAENNDFKNNYESAADLMALCIARHWDLENGKPDTYTNEIQIIIDFLLSKQNPGGDWDYFGRPSGQGDTSQVQFVLLALWSATDEGFEIPQPVWENAAEWLLKTQFENGGFSYHPRGPKDHGTEHGTTVAGVTGLLIAGIHLFSKQEIQTGRAINAKDPEAQVLNENPFETGDKPAKPKEAPKKVTGLGAKNLSLGQLTAAANAGVEYLVNDYRMAKVQRFETYYRYGIERLTAMLNKETLGEHDWYTDGATIFLKEQNADGSWATVYDGTHAATCFGILFLTRATWTKLLQTPLNELKGALQAGHRGLDLTDPGKLITNDEGEVVKKKFSGPLEDLLTDLIKNPQSKEAEVLSETLVDQFLTGKRSREELIGQKDNIKLLLESDNPQVRCAALWALGRCEDLSLCPLLIKALGERNLDVVIEARNALCILSRKPLGDGLAAHPWDDLPEDAPEQQKQAAAKEWQAALKERWSAWYERVRPYDQRDTLTEVGM